jgi:two-component system phosphate regulon response regulator PhoB
VRTVVCRFEDLAALRDALRTEEPELLSPEPIGDGEWVLVVIELGGGRATALAARGVVHEDRPLLVFEPRDWEVLRHFCETVPPPRAPEPRPETDRSPKSSRRGIKRPKKVSARVLVVDDDPDLREVVSAMLEAVGLTVQTAESAEDALAAVKSGVFDLLVLDWMLPGKSGLDLCREVRSLPKLEQLPVLFLTANTSSTDMVEAFASGADDYVVKPFRAPELGARIFGLLRRARPGNGDA